MAKPVDARKSLKKQVVDKDVLTLARERVSYLFDRFDHVAVSFSGGKDSTVCLHLALDEARKRGRLPLDVVFWDEEAIQPETVDYVREVSKYPGVALRWFCLPLRHRNACSRKQPFWNTWNPDERDKWCRELPPEAITDVPGFKPFMQHYQMHDLIYPESLGSVVVILGVRSDESLSRFRALVRRTVDNYIVPGQHYPSEPGGDTRPSRHVMQAKPIYDWSTADVWTFPLREGVPYNKAYDIMWKAGISVGAQRCAPPFAEEPLLNLWMYSQCWPDLWHKMLNRVPGAATAARYSRTELYAYGKKPERPPPGQTWQEFVKSKLALFGPAERQKISHRLRGMIDLHNKKTNFDPIPDVEPHPVSLMSWRFIATVAIRGDLRGRKIPTAKPSVYAARQAAEADKT